MQLLFSSSPNPEEFKWWFISETILILMNYVICIVASFMAPKLRFHIHFKICALFIFSQYFLFSTARLIVVGYQSGLLSYEGLPEENALIVACSWVRIYFLVMLQTMYSQKIAIIPLHFRTIPLIIERELAFYFIQDYSTKTRLWIPVLIIFVFVSIPALCATAAVFEWVPILCGLFFLDGLPGIVFPLFLWNYRKTWLLNNALKKRKFTRVKYTLAVRYQLEENLSFAEGIVFACAVIIVVHVMTFSQLILSQFAIFPSETNDILLRLFHLLIAADGPIITFGLFAHNAYFKKVAKEMFCGAPVEPYRDEGDSYFEQLEMQWEEPTEKKRKTNRQKAFLMRILWIYEE